VAYQQPVLQPHIIAGGGLSLNSFDVGGNLSGLGINGESKDIYGFMRYQFSRSRTEKKSATAGIHLKSSSSNVRSTLDSEDKLTVLYLSADYAGTSWSSSGAYQTANLTLSLGLEDFLGSMDGNGNGTSGRIGGSGQLAGGGFTKLEFSYSRAQKMSALQTLLFSFRGQLSSDLLTSLEQFSLGGPDTVRAYPVAEALMDQAYVFSVEWLAYASPDFQRGLLNKMQLSVFYDYASGTQNDPLQNEIESVSLSGFGGSIQIEPYKKFRVKAIMAFDLGDEPSDNMTLPFYISVNYDF
jgi:hemolysin activation/secretion protein